MAMVLYSFLYYMVLYPSFCDGRENGDGFIFIFILYGFISIILRWFYIQETSYAKFREDKNLAKISEFTVTSLHTLPVIIPFPATHNICPMLSHLLMYFDSIYCKQY